MNSSNDVEMCESAVREAQAALEAAKAAEARAMIAKNEADSACEASQVRFDASPDSPDTAMAYSAAKMRAESFDRALHGATASTGAAQHELDAARAREAEAREAAEIAALVEASSLGHYVHEAESELATIAAAMSAMTKAFANVATARKASNDALKKLHARGKCQHLRPLDGCADTGIILREMLKTNVHVADVRGLRFALASDSTGTIAFPGAMVAFMARYLDALVYKCSPVQLTEERNAVAIYPESRDISEANARAATTSKVKAA